MHLTLAMKNFEGGILASGSKKEILKATRLQALDIREATRKNEGLTYDVHALRGHRSKLVCAASYNINQMDINQLLHLLNQHGSATYAIVEEI